MYAFWRRVRNLKAPLAVALLPLAVLYFLARSKIHFGLNLADEGYLWYGSQRTAAGEVPIRDFSAYEPGRYYWTALWMFFAHDDGIVVMRWAAALFEGLAVFVGSWEVWRATRSVLIALLAMLTAMLLMNIWHARYEAAVAIMQVAVLARLLREPDSRRLFQGGLQVGIAGFFGRNLALYGLVGLVGVVAICSFACRPWLSWGRMGKVALGLALGTLPLVTMLVLIPHFGSACWGSILRLIELKTTNLSLPVPWLWTLHDKARLIISEPSLLIFSLFCLLPGPLFVLTIVWAGMKGRAFLTENSFFVSASVLALPYAHYVISRADPEHLMRGGAPLMLALATTPVSNWPAWRALPAFMMVIVTLIWLPEDSWAQGGACREARVGGDRLCIPDTTARIIEGTAALVQRYVTPGQAVMIAPAYPAIYAAMHLKAPNWEIYSAFPASRNFEQVEVKRIEAAATKLVVLSTYQFDGRPETRYNITHPIIWEYLDQAFPSIAQDFLPKEFRVGVHR